MQTILINYADRRFGRSQRLSALTAVTTGGVDQCLMYRRQDLDPEFVRANRFLLSQRRGAGLWIWKPYIILDALERARDGDVVIYCDAGARILRDLAPLADAARSLEHGVLGFEIAPGFIERRWTKRDAFVQMNCDSARFHDTPQMTGGSVVFVRRAASLDFVYEWLSLVCQVRLVSDLPSMCDEPEFPDFRAHRHDQSIFSLLYKEHGFRSCSDLTGLKVDAFFEHRALVKPSLMQLVPSLVHPAMYLKARRP